MTADNCDIVERLRQHWRYMPTFLAAEAANEIERLLIENKHLVVALIGETPVMRIKQLVSDGKISPNTARIALRTEEAMTDIVERLRKGDEWAISNALTEEAADEIERLRAEYTATLVRLRTLETQCFKLRTVVSLLSSSGAELLAAARNALEEE